MPRKAKEQAVEAVAIGSPQPNGGVSKATGYVIVDLRCLKSNTPQPRRNSGGVIPNLAKKGYGVFSQDEETVNKKDLKNEDGSDKRPILSYLLSDKPEDWPIGVALIDENEPLVKELANLIAGAGQLHNIGIMAIDENDDSKGYDIHYGMCRTLARAYNYARSQGALPCNIKAELATDINDPNDIDFRAMAENRGRREESYMDQARQYQFLKKNGAKVDEIAKKFGENPQNVRNRLKLLRLTKEEQERVHNKKLGIVKAMKLVDERDQGTKGPTETTGDIPENRKRMPSVKQAAAIYTATEKPEDMEESLWNLYVTADVRKFIAHFINVEYQSHREMVAAAKKAAKEEQERLEQAAQQAEADEAQAAETAGTNGQVAAAAK